MFSVEAQLSKGSAGCQCRGAEEWFSAPLSSKQWAVKTGEWKALEWRNPVKRQGADNEDSCVHSVGLDLIPKCDKHPVKDDQWTVVSAGFP